jgi:hypothetical protein
MRLWGDVLAGADLSSHIARLRRQRLRRAGLAAGLLAGRGAAARGVGNPGLLWAVGFYVEV